MECCRPASVQRWRTMSVEQDPVEELVNRLAECVKTIPKQPYRLLLRYTRLIPRAALPGMSAPPLPSCH